MSDIFSGVGAIAGAAIQAQAQRDAMNMQIEALEKQRDFVFKNLDPSLINLQAQSADVQRAQNQLALQGIIDPSLLQTRYTAQEAIAQQLGQLTGGADEEVARAATAEAVAGVPRMAEARDRLIDAALSELDAGATLPRDVQAELVRTGLERAGQVSGAASAEGFGGNILRRLIGSAGLELQAQRQQRAAQLTQAAQDLEGKRQTILQNLFPSLAQTQLAKLGGAQSALAASAALAPEAGLSGQNIANLWLARVGAQNQLAQQIANVGAQGTLGLGSAYGGLAAGLGRTAGGVFNAWQGANAGRTNADIADFFNYT